MKYDNLRAFEKHLESASPQLFSSIYFILGKETFDCHEAIHLILRFLLPSPEMRETALSIFDGSVIEEKELVIALDSYSFFAKPKVIWIQQAEKLRKNIQENLEKYAVHPQASQYLLLSASNCSKNSSFYKTLEREGVVLEFLEIKPWEKEKHLVEWVNRQMIANRKVITYSVCQLLVKKIGLDQALLVQEVEKLLCYCAEKKEITPHDVETICSQQSVDTIWQLGEALFRRDAPVALQIAHGLLGEAKGLLPLLRQIRSQYQIEYQIAHLLAQGKHSQEITQEFPYMKGQILERHVHQAQHYGLDSFKQGLLALDAMERRAKTSSVDEKILIELLVMQLIQY